jgi:nicotinamide mononucleotide transporter
MLNRRWIENWFVWVAVDIAYVGLYAFKGLYITGALYLLFIGLCVAGFIGWRHARKPA